MRVFKTKPFARFVRKAGVTDKVLIQAIADAERGLVDADLGGGVLKQRIAREGVESLAAFVHGFAKSERDNIRDDELAAFKMLAAEMLGYDDTAIARAMAAGVLMEVTGDEETIP